MAVLDRLGIVYAMMLESVLAQAPRSAAGPSRRHRDRGAHRLKTRRGKADAIAER